MRFAVVGHPVSHSRSPAIHTAAFAAAGIDASYIAVDVPPDGFATVTDWLRSGELDGVNVTMPHKAHARDAADLADDAARRTGAVNTLVRRDGNLEGHNTDIDGVRHALASIGAAEAERVAVLGTGGAARAAIVASPGRIAVMARRTDDAVDALRTTATEGDVLEWGTPVDGAVVINATPIGMKGERLPEPILASAGALVDMVYGPEQTPSMAWASHEGLPAADGIAMLIGQAVSAFEIFVGVRAPVDAMERGARGH